ncbi:MAG: 16S rRNA (guanine(527)-N(7))-methyltransferase RsmG [Pseudothermotoga sp.]
MKEINQFLNEYAIRLEENKIEKLHRYLEYLVTAPMNLTSVKEYHEALHKHIADVLIPVQSLQGEILDIGTGGGVPGVVLAIAFCVNVTLVESVRKKVLWLQDILQKLQIENTRVICSRAEDLPRQLKESFDVVTARAVAQMRILLELCAPFCKIGGRLLLYKGPNWEEEYAVSRNAMQILGVRLQDVVEYSLKTGEKRIFLVFNKVEKTPEIFPRKAGTILKKPL